MKQDGEREENPKDEGFRRKSENQKSHADAEKDVQKKGACQKNIQPSEMTKERTDQCFETRKAQAENRSGKQNLIAGGGKRLDA